MFMLSLYHNHTVRIILYYVAYKIYMIKDLFYHNLCHITFWSAESGNNYLYVTTCPSLSFTLTGDVRLRLRSWSTLYENPQASRNPRISRC